ncbi:hypothetical protein GGR51DRAFT_229352 [Nemania sp. FL0031]|nr:hypothetical protein GGR51DRAFT_229352 [Nemania sp. FL0031]
MPTLPPLRDEPTRYPSCCISLSTPLLATIASLLSSSHDPFPSPNTNLTNNEPALLLSIGSGTGLLEELLHAYLNHDTPSRAHEDEGRINFWRVEGVEVNPAVNIHLPEDRINHVTGTWAVRSTRAREAAALMFVYPRDGALVRRYVETFMDENESERGVPLRNEKSKADGNDVHETEEQQQREEDESGGEGRVPSSRRARLVLWLGPKCDWVDTGLGSCSKGDGEGLEIVEMREGAGLAEYEMLAVLRRKTTATMSVLRRMAGIPTLSIVKAEDGKVIKEQDTET